MEEVKMAYMSEIAGINKAIVEVAKVILDTIENDKNISLREIVWGSIFLVIFYGISIRIFSVLVDYHIKLIFFQHKNV